MILDANIKNSEFFKKITNIVEYESCIHPKLFDEYNIKRGLRNKNGTGVLVGLTKIASVIGYEKDGDVKLPLEGKLYYRGITLTNLVKGIESEGRCGFEEVIYLLVFGKLPDADELREFQGIINSLRELPDDYIEDVILKLPSKDIMNKLMRSTLSLYSYDEDPDNTDIPNVLLQSLNLIAKFPLIMAYCFQAKRYYTDKETLILHQPKPDIGIAETILSLVREDGKYTTEEVELLDLLLIVHAEHGGGNNSAFATHVVSSSGTDTYSSISAALGSLKGPRHGGAALQVSGMFEDADREIKDKTNDEDIRSYIKSILNKEAYDKSGLIYGMGHAIYTLSDPRSVLLRKKAEEVAKVKGEEFVRELDFLKTFEKIAGEELNKAKPGDYNRTSNVDFYSGFVYKMLGFPKELYTPLFATARIAGWCAHRLEQLSDRKIIRPGYVTLGDEKEYIPMEER